MKKTVKKKAAGGSAEERIKAAARKVFTQKGFKATRTRDIAQEAGINLALLNYYFRSKEKLFDIIMLENLQKFMQGVYFISHDEKTSWQQKVDLLVNYYIDMLVANPGVPMFVLNEISSNPVKLAKMMSEETHLLNSPFMKQINQGIKRGEIIKVNPLQLLANIMGLTLFPFMAAPLIKIVGKITDEDFTEMMAQRKKLVPAWIKQTMTIK